MRNGKESGTLKGYSGELLAAEAVQWHREQRDTNKPFFLCACYHEPHEPIATAGKYRQLYTYKDPASSAHHGNISQLDSRFGRLLDDVKELGLQDITMVIFTSDNGPAITTIHPSGSAGPFWDKKGTVYEGGIRVPGFVRWPGKLAAGAASDVPISALDFLPTFANSARLLCQSNVNWMAPGWCHC